MKTLIFNGSPRKDGDTAALIREMKKYLDGQITTVSAYYDGISPCLDCRSCWQKPGCSLQDPMQEIYQGLPSYDNIVLASPLHFSELSGSLLSVISRLQALWTARCFCGEIQEMKDKNGVLILTGGGEGSPARAETMAKIIFKQLNTACISKVFSLHTNQIPAREDREALAQAKEASLKLNRLFHANAGNF